MFLLSSLAKFPWPITRPTWGFLQINYTALPVSSCLTHRYPHSLNSHILPIMLLSSPLSFPFSLILRYRFEMWCVFFLSIQTWYLPLSWFSESIAYLPSFSPLSATSGTMVHLLSLCPYAGFDTDFFHVVNRPSSFLIFPTLTFCFMLKYWWIF